MFFKYALHTILKILKFRIVILNILINILSKITFSVVTFLVSAGIFQQFKLKLKLCRSKKVSTDDFPTSVFRRNNSFIFSSVMLLMILNNHY